MTTFRRGQRAKDYGGAKEVSSARKFSPLGAILLLALGAIVAWQVVSTSLVAYLARIAPEAALRLRSSAPEALLNLAEIKLNQGQAPEGQKSAGPPVPFRESNDNSDGAPETRRIGRWADSALRLATESIEPEETTAPLVPYQAPTPQMLDQIRRWTETVLTRDPINSRALRILGQLADIAGDEARASKLMQAASRLSVRESLAFYWLMRKSYEKHDYTTTIYCADTLLRTRTDIADNVLMTLFQAAENRRAVGELTKLLGTNPPWRSHFFRAIPGHVSDPRTPLELLLAVKDTPTPPTSADLGSYLDFLIERNLYELAYYAWLQFLSPEQLRNAGAIFNASFELKPSGLVFDWVVTPIGGASVEITRRSDKDSEKALSIEFAGGRVNFHHVSQLIMLAPGTYRFEGQYKANISSRRGMRWRISCAEGEQDTIGESAMVTGVTRTWTHFEFSFEVPSANCRPQQLLLEHDARMASEEMISGSISYDELQISRVGTISKPQ